MTPHGLRVLHLVHASPLAPEAGGCERYVRALAQATGAPVFTRDRSHSAPLTCDESSGFPLWTLGLPVPANAVFEDTWRIRKVTEALEKVLEQASIDLVHVHHAAHLGFEAVTRGKELGIPLVFTLHDAHMACARGQWVNQELERCDGPEPDRCARCLGPHLRATPSLARIGKALRLASLGRRVLGGIPPGPAQRDRAEARILAGRDALRRADSVVSPSRYLASRMVDLGWVEPDRMHVVDLPLVGPVKPAPVAEPGPVRFLFVGSLIPTKGPQVLVEAFAGLPTTGDDATLSLWGPAPGFDGAPRFAEDLKRRIRQAPGIRYRGMFDGEARSSVYAEADVLVLPSTWEENSPLVAREAAAAGLRIVASRVGGLPELVPGARWVPPGDADALREALREEVRQGRGRIPCRSWPMEPHVKSLGSVYEATLVNNSKSTAGFR